MAADIHFPPFRLDLSGQRLWRGSDLVAIRPKPWALLRYLVENPERLLTKDEVLAAVWPDAVVSEWALAKAIREVRVALDDDPEHPSFVETVHRRGYRFLAQIRREPPAAQAAPRLASVSPPPAFVGREPELARLRACLAAARTGHRRIVFISGEPGIGKSALVDAFLHELSTSPTTPAISRGQCFEQYGSAEPYMPLLEVLERLCAGTNGAAAIATLRTFAPTWLTQIPGQVEATEAEGLRASLAGATAPRMLRELARALEALSGAQPLVVVLEDLHWSDHATLDALSLLAQRDEACRLLLLATYRPVDAVLTRHPILSVVREMRAHHRCVDMPLELLGEAAVHRYVQERFPQNRLPPAFTALIMRRTEGNALFVVNLLEHLRGQGMLCEDAGGWRLAADLSAVASAIPDSVYDTIQKQLERVDAHQRRLLEVASIAGLRFASHTLAAVMEGELEEIESAADDLVKRQLFLNAAGTEVRPNGGATARYEFAHALYQNVLYRSVGSARRQRLHREIGVALEQAYAGHAAEIATELAGHFEAAGEPARALPHRQHAARVALERLDRREAMPLLKAVLSLLHAVADERERDRIELDARMGLIGCLMETRAASADVESHATRALALCARFDKTPYQFFTLYALSVLHAARAELERSLELSQQMVALAEAVQVPFFVGVAHSHRGSVRYWRGELGAALDDFEQVGPFVDLPPSTMGVDAETNHLSMFGLTLSASGALERGILQIESALTRARRLGQVLTLVNALLYSSAIRSARRDIEAAHRQALEARALAIEYDLAFMIGPARLRYGECLLELGKPAEARAELRSGIEAFEAAGATLLRSQFLCALGTACGHLGRTDEALAHFRDARAHAEKSGERFLEPVIWERQGEVLQAQRATEARECFARAIDIAHRQGARVWELQAALRLASLQRNAESRCILDDVTKRFHEGHDTPLLQAAFALLENRTTQRPI